MKNLILVLISSILFVGCNNNNKEIKVYEIIHHNKAIPQAAPKAHDPHDGHNHEGHDHGTAKTPAASTSKATSSELTWKAPTGWKEIKGNSIRLVSFKIAENAECTFIVLSGQAGGLLSNVNRWRGQIGLSQIGEPAVKKAATLVKTPLADAQMFKLVNPNNKDLAFIASIIPKGSSTLFVKLAAPSDMIPSLEGPYLELLKSISTKE
ncbi:MAG: hypothetical protein KC646_08110 [Candidatus Cloacimonetes bacterium]|nr:hypothetical protein [Candidatus Cloacimonadota bacterium]